MIRRSHRYRPLRRITSSWRKGLLIKSKVTAIACQARGVNPPSRARNDPERASGAGSAAATRIGAAGSRGAGGSVIAAISVCGLRVSACLARRRALASDTPAAPEKFLEPGFPFPGQTHIAQQFVVILTVRLEVETEVEHRLPQYFLFT